MGLVSFDLKLPDFGLLILSQIDEKEDLLDGFRVVLILQLDYIYKQFREESIMRMNARTSLALREESITRTVYVSDIDQQVDSHLLRAKAIENSKDADQAVDVVLKEIIPYLSVESEDQVVLLRQQQWMWGAAFITMFNC